MFCIVKRNGSFLGEAGDTDFCSDALKLSDRAAAMLVSMRWIGSHVVELQESGVKYEHEPLTRHEQYASHICAPVPERW
jgi:hypothetical protein